MWGFENYPRRRKNKNAGHDYQITDLLQLSRKEMEARQCVLHTMRRFEDWKKLHDRYDARSVFAYLSFEGLILKRQVRNAIFFYKMVKRGRVKAFDAYMDRLPAAGGVYGASR